MNCKSFNAANVYSINGNKVALAYSVSDLGEKKKKRYLADPGPFLGNDETK